MPNNTITSETNEIQFNLDLTIFINNATTNKSLLGLSPTDLSDMGKVFSDFSTSLNAAGAAKTAALTATSDKNAKRKAAKALVSKWAKVFRANQAVPDSVLESLLLPPHVTPPTHSAPTQPTNLTLSVNSVGDVTLGWSRNGNGVGTIFNVETAEVSEGPWTTFDMTTKTKLAYQGTPGTPVWFRVSAKRNGNTSSFSLPISLWANGGGTSIKLAA